MFIFIPLDKKADLGMSYDNFHQTCREACDYYRKILLEQNLKVQACVLEKLLASEDKFPIILASLPEDCVKVVQKAYLSYADLLTEINASEYQTDILYLRWEAKFMVER